MIQSVMLVMLGFLTAGLARVAVRAFASQAGRAPDHPAHRKHDAPDAFRNRGRQRSAARQLRGQGAQARVRACQEQRQERRPACGNQPAAHGHFRHSGSGGRDGAPARRAAQRGGGVRADHKEALSRAGAGAWPRPRRLSTNRLTKSTTCAARFRRGRTPSSASEGALLLVQAEVKQLREAMERSGSEYSGRFAKRASQWSLEEYRAGV